MKRALALVLLTIVLLLNGVLLQAQDSASISQDEDRARSDYLFQYANYAEAYQAYKTAKETYQKFSTITAQKEAVEKTKAVLILRAEVLRTYLQRLKLRLISKRQLDSGLRESEVGKLEATQAFLETHKANVEKINSLAEVNAESGRLEREANSISDLSYEVLGYVLIGEIQGLEVRARLLLEEQQKATEAKDRSFEEGVSEINRKLTQVRVTADRANQILADYQSGKTKTATKGQAVYQAVQAEMRRAKTTLKEATQLIKELKNL